MICMEVDGVKRVLFKVIVLAMIIAVWFGDFSYNEITSKEKLLQMPICCGSGRMSYSLGKP